MYKRENLSIARKSTERENFYNYVTWFQISLRQSWRKKRGQPPNNIFYKINIFSHNSFRHSHPILSPTGTESLPMASSNVEALKDDARRKYNYETNLIGNSDCNIKTSTIFKSISSKRTLKAPGCSEELALVPFEPDSGLTIYSDNVLQYYKRKSMLSKMHSI